MKVISDFNNEEGIEILMKVADDIQAIMTDAEVSEALDKGNFMKIGAVAYKKCRKNVEKVFDALGEKPVTALGYAAGITKVILDVVKDPAFKDFFTFVDQVTDTDTISPESAMESTQAEV